MMHGAHPQLNESVFPTANKLICCKDTTIAVSNVGEFGTRLQHFKQEYRDKKNIMQSVYNYTVFIQEMAT